MDAGRIRYPLKARHTRQHGVIAHEIGHWALRRGGADDRDEAACRYLAGALMLPREAFVADLGRLDWDLFAQLATHVNASAEMVVCRMTQVSPATASVWDCGALTRCYGPHDVDADREIVSAVLEREAPVRDGNVGAWPMFDGSERRVLCVRRAA